MAGEEVLASFGAFGILACLVMFVIMWKVGLNFIWSEFKFQLIGRKGAVEIEKILKNGLSETTVTKNANEFSWGKDKETGIEIKTTLVKPYNTSAERKIPKFYVFEGGITNWNPFERPNLIEHNKRLNYIIAEGKQIGRLEAAAQYLDKLGTSKWLLYAAVAAAIFAVIAVGIGMQNNDLLIKMAGKLGVATGEGFKLIPGT